MLEVIVPVAQIRQGMVLHPVSGHCGHALEVEYVVTADDGDTLVSIGCACSSLGAYSLRPGHVISLFTEVA